MKKLLSLLISCALAFSLTACSGGVSKNEAPKTRISGIEENAISSNESAAEEQTVPIYKDGSINNEYINMVRSILDDEYATVTGDENGYVNIDTQTNYADTEAFILKCSVLSSSIVSDLSVKMIILKFGGDAGGILVTSWDGDITHLMTSIKINENEPLKDKLEKYYAENSLFALYDMDKKINEAKSKLE